MEMFNLRELVQDVKLWGTNNEKAYVIWIEPAIQGAESWEDTAAAIVREYLNSECELEVSYSQMRRFIPAEMVEQLAKELEAFYEDEIREYAEAHS